MDFADERNQKLKVDLTRYPKPDQNTDDMKTGELIRYKRTRIFNMSQDEFAAKFGVPLGTLRNWEQGVSTPPVYFMKLLEDEEALLSSSFATPLEKMRSEKEQYVDTSARRRLLREYANDNINANELYKKTRDVIEDIMRPEGLLENLQNIYPYFDEATASDISMIMILSLLQEINAKLDKLIS